MNAQQYQAAARRTAKSLPTTEALDHMIMGLISDFGELVSAVKAIQVYNKPIDEVYDKKQPEKGTTRDYIRIEAGDVNWFLAYGCDIVGLQFQDVVAHPVTDPAYTSFGQFHKDSVYWSKLGASTIGDLSMHILTNPPAVLLHPTNYCHQQYCYYLAKVHVCVTQIAFWSDITEEQIWESNIAKLRKRYPDAYTDQAARRRADMD